jgi:murein L,D-transpeptidase YcbB/YkuD
MKKFIIIALILNTAGACNLIEVKNKESKSENTEMERGNSTNTNSMAAFARDLSIDSSNAYSDLFLDSTHLEDYIKKEKLSDTISEDLRNFYDIRNYQYAWFTSDGFTEQGRGFWNLYHENDGGDKPSKRDKRFQQRMDTLLENDSLTIAPTDSLFSKTELQLTQQFLQYAKKNSLSNTTSNVAIYHLVPAKKSDPLLLADSILNKQKDTAQFTGKSAYSLLRQQLSVYYVIAQKGGWQPVTGSIKLKKGTSSPVVSAIKKRLGLTGDYSTTDTSALFSDSLEAAIKNYQQRAGFQPNGIITDSIIRVMNVPAEKRIEQIILNMNRALWMPAAKDSNIIQVNIPSFMLSAYEGSTRVFDMPVVVGKEGTNTMMFTGDLNEIVFSPYWNIPASIVQNEILPAMKKDKTYLQKHHMEIVSGNDSLPTIRQLPGADNSLGKAKFLFPNSYDIYFHDTPHKELFEKKNRALSHGCIRLANAEKMAGYLLRDQKEWMPEKINTAMNSGKEQRVSLSKPVPVFITYYTAWIDENGGLNFRDDVYGHDKKTGSRLFKAAQTTKRIV